MGFSHGLFCVGCCWALMATLLAVGLTGMAWMSAIAVATWAEQTLPFGHRLRVPMGVALVAAGAVKALR
jgi:predicted metal-binding membrane protein